MHKKKNEMVVKFNSKPISFSILSLVFCLLIVCISSVPVYVMMPLDLIDPNTGQLKDFNKLASQVKTVASSGVDGFMIDLWWGVIERTPKSYNFEAYRKIFNLAAANNLKVQVVFSFRLFSIIFLLANTKY